MQPDYGCHRVALLAKAEQNRHIVFILYEQKEK